jgi:hypothetical protein|tara:strand:+ start:397 stop:633 length:237 start_codon:yes stop_codon:yes gene_type:complete
MKTVIHVNQHKIRSNIKLEDPEPVLTVKNYKQNRYAHEVVIKANGDEVARIVYRPHKPLSCGARCWIETTQEVELIDG